MKIAYVVSSKKKCGPNIVILNIVKELANKHEMEIFFLDESDDDVFECVNVKSTQIKKASDLKEHLKRFDIIHSSGIRPDALVVLCKVIYRVKCKIITTIHNYVFQDLYYSYGLVKSLIWGLLWCSIWLFFDKLVILSKNADNYYWFLPSAKKNIIYNGIDDNDCLQNKKCNYRKEFNIPDDGILAGSCANLTKCKGIDLVIQTLTKEHKIYYIVAGDGIEKHNLINLVKARKLHERVYFIDFLDEPESFMFQLDVFLMPSRSEGFGLTVLESTKLGIPVITSNIPIFMELFDQMCLTFDIKNPSTLIDVITYAKKNRLHLSQKFHAIFQDRFTSSKMATKYENVYNNLFREVL